MKVELIKLFDRTLKDRLDSTGFRKCPFTLSDLKIFEGNHVNSSPKRKRDIYYPLLHEDGRSSVQMMTIMDMDSNRLVLNEIVLQDHASS